MLQNTQFRIPNLPSTTIRSKPHINATYTQPLTHPSHMSSNVSNTPTYNTVLHLQNLSLHFHNQHT